MTTRSMVCFGVSSPLVGLATVHGQGRSGQPHAPAREITRVRGTRRRLWAKAALSAALVCLASCMETTQVSEAVGSELAPAGALRAGINLSNPILVAADSATAELRGIAPDVARELARRLSVPVRFVPYPTAAAAADDAGSGKWDVAFIGSDPAREGTMMFTAPYVELQSTYLVPVGSAIRTVADVDADGVRVAARPRTAYDLVLRRLLTRATLVYPDDSESDLDLLTSGKADALAGLRQVLVDAAQTIPGSRVLDDDFTAIQQAMGVPKAHKAALAYLEEFVSDIKASGLVADAIEKSGVSGASVARE